MRIQWTRQRCQVGFEHALYRRPEAAVRVRDDKLGAVEPARLQAAQKVHPEGLGFRWSEPEANDFPASVSVGCDRYYCSNADDPPALAPF